MHVAAAPRRGLLLVGAAILALIATAVLVAETQPYDASWHVHSTVLLVPPQTDANTTTGQNALLRLNGRSAQLKDGLTSLAPVVARALDGPAARSDLRAQGATGSFTVRSHGVVLRFSVQAASADSARRTAGALLAVTRDQLVTLQNRASVPGSARITAIALTTSTPTRPGAFSRWWTIVLAALLVVIALVCLLGAAVGRRRRRGGTPYAPGPAGPTTPRPRTRRTRRSAGTVAPRSR